MYGPVLENARLALIRLDTGERMLLGDDEGYAARYVSSGHLVYGRAGIVMAVPFDLDNHSMSGTATQMLTNVFTKQAGAQSITVSDDGSLAFIPGDGTEERRLVWVNRTGDSTPVEGAPIRNYGVPRLSPNRNQIAVQVVESPSANILRYDFGRSTISSVATGVASPAPPIWTLDGERITFVAPDGTVQSMLADGSGSVETLLAGHEQGLTSPVAWLPDGSTLAFYNEVGSFLLREGAVEQLFLQAGVEFAQSFSPDGRLVAYVSAESGRQEVYVGLISDPKRIRWQVSTNGGDEALFSSDGHELFYRRGDKMIAASIELEPTFRLGQQTELFSYEFLTSPSGPGYDYDAKNKRFLMVQRPEEALLPRIHVVLNWFEELKRLVPADE